LKWETWRQNKGRRIMNWRQPAVGTGIKWYWGTRFTSRRTTFASSPFPFPVRYHKKFLITDPLFCRFPAWIFTQLDVCVYITTPKSPSTIPMIAFTICHVDSEGDGNRRYPKMRTRIVFACPTLDTFCSPDKLKSGNVHTNSDERDRQHEHNFRYCKPRHHKTIISKIF
jgi:hypothetical protein